MASLLPGHDDGCDPKTASEPKRSVESDLAAPQNLPLDELHRCLAVVRDRVRGVALRRYAGFYLFGPAGSAKTFTVRNTLDEEKFPYIYQDGHLTPMGLFDLLAEHHDKVIVLDDVSALLGNKIALQILLAALGSQPDRPGERIVKYRRQGSEATVRFMGGLILISNLDLHNQPLLEALKSRVHYLHYNPTDEQIAALMRSIAANGRKDLSSKDARAVAEFVIEKSRSVGIRLDVRLLVDKAIPDFLQWRSGQAEMHWRDLVTTTLKQQLVRLEHTTEAHRARWEWKREEQAIVRAIVSEHRSREQQLAAWVEETGKSERAFYRRLRELGAG
jgi:hypothetical protein